METGLFEIGLKHLFELKICTHVDQIDKITTCLIVNTEHKNISTKKALKPDRKGKLETWNIEVVQK